jgi:excisionase family DNA binding protein
MENDCVLLTIKQVSSITGLAVGTLYHFVSQRRIPIVRISARCVRFRRSDIDAWLAKRVIPPVPDNIPAPHL